MLTSVVDQMPTVVVEHPYYAADYFPAKDIDTHRMLSHTALKIARIDEPICFQEWYQKHEGHYWGHLEVFYHHDHIIRWDEIYEAIRYDFLTGGLMWSEPKAGWCENLRMEAQHFRVNFIPTVRR